MAAPRARLPQDPPFQTGLSLAVVGPFLTSLGGAIAIRACGGSGEVGIMWGVLHVVAFGVLQWAWIIPVALVSLALGAKRFALGLCAGGTILLAANGLSYAFGLWLGAW